MGHPGREDGHTVCKVPSSVCGSHTVFFAPVDSRFLDRGFESCDISPGTKISEVGTYV